MSEMTDFERNVQELFGYTPQQTRVMIRIGQMQEELRNALRGSELADDTDALLLFVRLTPRQQVTLAQVLQKGLMPELALALMQSGLLADMLDEAAE